MKTFLRGLASVLATFKKPARGESGPPAIALNTLPEDHPVSASPVAVPDVRAVEEKADHVAESAIVLTFPDQHEIDRRRDLIRALFNDFWRDRDDKPASFVDRLNRAEGYLNERLLASGERWQPDAKTRDMLGLPARSNSRRTINGRPI
jgi:hypothetical protein